MADKEANTVVVHFGREQYRVATEVTGSELRRVFGVPAGDNLYLAQGSKALEPPIGDDEVRSVENGRLKNGMHFTSAPKAVEFGAA